MWQESNNQLQQQFVFNNFSAALAFIVRVGIEAEKLDHHPTITNTYNKVDIMLTTHSKGNTVTDLDRILAKNIDMIL